MTQFIPTPFTKTHTLRWPIQDDKEQPIKQVTMRTLPLAQLRGFRTQHGFDAGEVTDAQTEAFLGALICAATGLSDAERGRLASPDYNSLRMMSQELVMKPSSKLHPQPENADRIPLLVPLEDPEHGVVDSYQLQPPTVKATEIVNAAHSGFEREVQLAAICTGLDVSTIWNLHMPDWVRVQSEVSNFLDEPAAFYPSPTSNA